MTYSIGDDVILRDISDYGRKITLTNGKIVAAGTYSLMYDDGGHVVEEPIYTVNTGNHNIKAFVHEDDLCYSYKLKMITEK